MLNNIRVECYSGHRGEETPRRFWVAQRLVEINQVIDCWLAPHQRYFKVLGDDGDIYILRHDPYAHAWEMTFFSKEPAAKSDHHQ